jgi:DNA-binding NarL/FixJ family response regulator
MDRISILIADDEETVVETLAAVVAAEPDLEVVASAHDAGTAIELASREQPDVAIIDVRMPGGGGVRAAREIVRRSPPTHVLAFSAHEDASTVLAMLRAGAIGYVVKGESTQEIVKAIHQCVDERTTISGLVTNELAHTLAEQLHHARPESARGECDPHGLPTHRGPRHRVRRRIGGARTVRHEAKPSTERVVRRRGGGWPSRGARADGYTRSDVTPR